MDYGIIPLNGLAVGVNWASLPDHQHVRATLAGDEGNVSEPTLGMAVIDCGLKGMVVPIGWEDWQMRRGTWTPVELVAELTVERLAFARQHLRKLIGRERKMRAGFERDVARLGGGAAPRVADDGIAGLDQRRGGCAHRAGRPQPRRGVPGGLGGGA